MERWKIGKMERWKVGRLERWKVGRLDDFTTETLRTLRRGNGRMEY